MAPAAIPPRGSRPFAERSANVRLGVATSSSADPTLGSLDHLGNGVRVLRLCSVFEAPVAADPRGRHLDLVGGMQIHTARLTAALADRGVRQTVLTSYRPSASRVERPTTGTTILRVGIGTRAFRQLYGPAALPTLASTGDRVDLVHAHLGEDLAVLLLARLAMVRFRVPLVITVHCGPRSTLEGHDARSFVLRAVGGRIERRVEASADAVFVLSDRAAELTRSVGIDRARVHVVPVGVDIERFARDRSRIELRETRRSILYLGRLVPEKGVNELLVAVSRLRATDATLLLVGDGPERSRLERLASSLGIAHRCRFVGAVDHHEVPLFLEQADVLVLPSWYEELGRVLVEAMAASVPVVASRTGGIPSIV